MVAKQHNIKTVVVSDRAQAQRHNAAAAAAAVSLTVLLSLITSEKHVQRGSTRSLAVLRMNVSV
eukprot:6174658-Pleurochrysis_carterae.AAC.1